MNAPLILFLLFVGVPILEIAVFIQIGALVGTAPTLFGVLVTAVIGAWLVRLQGFGVWRDAQAALARRELPVEPLAHGILILSAGILLMTPGYVTDTFGFLLLIPPIRLRVARTVMTYLKSHARMHVMQTRWNTEADHDATGMTIDGEATTVEDRTEHD